MKLPWRKGERPIMLAPMQGITNRALRDLFVERYAPDIVFTEFIPVRSGAKKPVSKNDCREVSSIEKSVPLIVQLIGSETKTLIEAAKTVQGLGAEHINLNLGCPYGRMANKTAGGSLLGTPSLLVQILTGLRPHVRGSFSVKLRSGIEDSSELPGLVTLFEDCGIDFIILHPRTVQQKYGGAADHRVTAGAVQQSSLPVIANGDIFTADDGWNVLEQTGCAGLMLGRGAIADPFLFDRIRRKYNNVSPKDRRREELRSYFLELLKRYDELFCGDNQVLAKMKEVVRQVNDPDLGKTVQKLLKSKRLDRFVDVLENL